MKWIKDEEIKEGDGERKDEKEKGMWMEEEKGRRPTVEVLTRKIGFKVVKTEAWVIETKGGLEYGKEMRSSLRELAEVKAIHGKSDGGALVMSFGEKEDNMAAGLREKYIKAAILMNDNKANTEQRDDFSLSIGHLSSVHFMDATSMSQLKLIAKWAKWAKEEKMKLSTRRKINELTAMAKRDGEGDWNIHEMIDPSSNVHLMADRIAAKDWKSIEGKELRGKFKGQIKVNFVPAPPEYKFITPRMLTTRAKKDIKPFIKDMADLKDVSIKQLASWIEDYVKENKLEGTDREFPPMSMLIKPETILDIIRDKLYKKKAAELGTDNNSLLVDANGRGGSFDARFWNEVGEEEEFFFPEDIYQELDEGMDEFIQDSIMNLGEGEGNKSMEARAKGVLNAFEKGQEKKEVAVFGEVGEGRDENRDRGVKLTVLKSRNGKGVGGAANKGKDGEM